MITGDDPNHFYVPDWDSDATVDENPPINDPLEDYRPPSDLKITRPVKVKHEIKFTKKQVKKGKFKTLSDLEWKLIHAKRAQLVNNVKNLLKPIRNYSKKNKRDLINSLQVMKDKVKQFY